MKLKKFLALVCAAVTVGFAAISCSDDDPIIPSLEVNPVTIEATASAADYTATVTTNVAWTATVTSNSAWCTLVEASATGNGTVKLHVAENTAFESRTATIAVAAGNLTIEITVVQAAAEQTFDVIDFENAELNADGILRYGTLIGEDDNEMGNFWEAYSEAGITFRSYEGTDPYLMGFWCGFEVSNSHDMTTSGYANEASAYNEHGHSGSKFALGYDGGSMMGPGYESEFYVSDATEKTFDHVYVANSTYAALEMLNGGYGKQFSYADQDWFKLTITGIGSDGADKGSVEFYLADFRTAGSGGVVSEWTKVDLKSLGAVQKLQFSLSSSDVGAYGMNTPAYFCLDDLAIQK
jgi:hypothetical protein